jgi:hypothetical protein
MELVRQMAAANTLTCFQEAFLMLANLQTKKQIAANGRTESSMMLDAREVVEWPEDRSFRCASNFTV